MSNIILLKCEWLSGFACRKRANGVTAMCEGLNVYYYYYYYYYYYLFTRFSMPCRCITIIANMDVNLHEPLKKTIVLEDVI